MPMRIMLATLALAGSMFFCTPARAQVYDDLDKAWKWEQNQRKEANTLIFQQPTEPAKVREGIARLEKLLEYFADPRTIEMAKGQGFLAQPNDIHTDIAIGYALIGENDRAAHHLQQLIAGLDAINASVGTYAFGAELLTSRLPATARQDPAIAAIIRQLASKDPYKRYRADTITSPYSEQLSEAQRIAGLSLFWAEVKYNFANFDLVPDLDWDAEYLAAIPRVRAAQNTRAYYRVLEELCAKLNDAHTNVNLPGELAHLNVMPPIATALIEDRVLITNVYNQALNDLGLARGQEITHIEGEPVKAYAQREIAPIVCASTPQDRDVRTYYYHLFRGDAAKPIRLTVSLPDGPSREITVPRSGYKNSKFPPSYSLSERADGVVVVTANTFGDDSVAEQFEKDLPRILKAKALVIDIRENDGGSSSVGYRMLACLTNTPFTGSRSHTPAYNPTLRAWGQAPASSGFPLDTYQPRPGERFDGPVAVLIGSQTISAAEDFAVAFDTLKRGPLVGTPTGGSTGQPLRFRLPGGGSARVCAKRDAYADGREFVGKGVQPTILVMPTIAALRTGQDVVLDRAVTDLLKAAR